MYVNINSFRQLCHQVLLFSQRTICYERCKFRIFNLQGTAIQFAISVNSLFILTVKFDKDLSQVLLGTQINMLHSRFHYSHVCTNKFYYNSRRHKIKSHDYQKSKNFPATMLNQENLLQICWNINLYKSQFKYSQMV